MDTLGTKAPAKPEAENKPMPAAPPREPGRHPLMALRDEMDRLFDDFFAGFSMLPFRRRFAMDPWRRVQGMFEQAGTFPALDMAADEKEYRITLELPGMDEKDIELTLGDDMMTVRGEKRQEREKSDRSHVVL